MFMRRICLIFLLLLISIFSLSACACSEELKINVLDEEVTIDLRKEKTLIVKIIALQEDKFQRLFVHGVQDRVQTVHIRVIIKVGGDQETVRINRRTERTHRAFEEEPASLQRQVTNEFQQQQKGQT